jgi:hypothetical protein
LTIFLEKSCEGQNKQDLESAVIEYNRKSRGFYQKDNGSKSNGHNFKR